MSDFVLDASVALRWYLDRPIPAYAQGILNRLAAGAVAVVPMLWRLEVANGVLVAERRGLLNEADASGALARVELLARALEWVEDGVAPWPELTGLGRRHRLSAYDSLYLWIARQRAVPLATGDLVLRRAATAAGVALLA